MSRPLDRARARLRDIAGPELVERLEHLDATRRGPRVDRALAAPGADDRLDADVIFAGGGLSLLVAAELAGRGVKVLVVERARAGDAHREWNASRDELAVLVERSIVTAEELEQLVVARYDYGICRFGSGESHAVRGVLDHAVDAGPLLERVRRVCVERGVTFLDGHSVVGLGAGRSAVRVLAEANGREVTLTGRILVDARGAASPYRPSDLVCPTVGGVLTGLVEGTDRGQVDRRVGDILVTTEGAEAGRQHVWEGFPGRPGETTVYLFYYATEREPVSLLALYDRFFTTLGTYKRGEASMIRPTFGYIPGWSRLTKAPALPSPRVALVGDAAARHSPLTFCGFGSMLRSFVPAARALEGAVSGGSLAPCIVDDAPIHGWTGALARLMASRALSGSAMNELLDSAFATLADMGDARYRALLQDRMGAPEFVDFLRRTAHKRPSVYGDVLRGLGPWASASWGFGLAREALRKAS